MAFFVNFLGNLIPQFRAKYQRSGEFYLYKKITLILLKIPLWEEFLVLVIPEKCIEPISGSTVCSGIMRTLFVLIKFLLHSSREIVNIKMDFNHIIVSI